MATSHDSLLLFNHAMVLFYQQSARRTSGLITGRGFWECDSTMGGGVGFRLHELQVLGSDFPPTPTELSSGLADWNHTYSGRENHGLVHRWLYRR